MRNKGQSDKINKIVAEISCEDESDTASDVEIDTIEEITEVQIRKGEKEIVKKKKSDVCNEQQKKIKN